MTLNATMIILVNDWEGGVAEWSKAREEWGGGRGGEDEVVDEQQQQKQQ